VDDLLAKAKPKVKITVWREGDHTEFGRATTSGITVPVFERERERAATMRWS